MKLFRNVLLGLCLLTQTLFAQNRVATLADVKQYGDVVTVGDWIADLPTKINIDGINQLRYTNFSKTFPGVRENANLWIDGDRIGKLCEIRLLNGTETTPWHISNATLRPIPNTRVDGIYTANSYGGFLYLVQGLLNFKMDGNSEKYPGLVGLKKGDFLKGRFGFSGTSTGYYGGYHVYSISVLNGGSFYFTGLEGEHGFSVLRFQGGSYDWNVTLTGENCYFHDSKSELLYIGATHAPPYAKILVLLRNLILARSGSEPLQLQHIVGDSWIRNITAFANDASHKNAFQPYQDTGMQLSPDEGNIKIEKIVLDSWGSIGITCFGAPYESLNKNIKISKVVMPNGRGEGIYKHGSDKYNMKWLFDSLWILNLNSDYYIGNKAPNPSWIINVSSTDMFKYTNVFYKDQPDVLYVNSGFHEPGNKVKFYTQFMGKYLSGVDLEPAKYVAGEVLEDQPPLKSPVYYKVIRDFTATTATLENHPDCVAITWDSNTTRSDQPTWCSTCDQKPYPPDDLRVRSDSYYGKLDIGFVEDKPSYETLLVKITDLENKVIEQDSTIKFNEILYNELSNMFMLEQQKNRVLRESIDKFITDVNK